MSDDFYVGYQASAPRSLARFVVRVVLFTAATAMVIAVLLVAQQQLFPPSSFAYGEPRTYTGTVLSAPVPSLALDRGRTAILVGPGKHGADSLIEAFGGKYVDLSAMRIQRDGEIALELVPGSIRAVSGAVETEHWEPAGHVRLTGEIVDSKCYLGVMNPGEGKVHRDCAARCISGGIPPAFIAKDRSGTRKVFLLTGPGGTSINSAVLPYVGEPIDLEGDLYRSNYRDCIEIDVQKLAHRN